LGYLLSLFHHAIPTIAEVKRITPVDKIIREIDIVLDPPADGLAPAKETTGQSFRIVKDREVIPPPAEPEHPTTAPTGSGSASGVDGGNTMGMEGSGTSGNVGTAAPAPVETNTFETFVSQMPSFPGEMPKYLANHINYPTPARENGIEGKVVISFVVMPDGSIKQVQLLKGIGFGCDEEALRVVSTMPNWNAGKQNGKAKAVKMVLPIVFQLQ
jgi:periplasmic protein TonB